MNIWVRRSRIEVGDWQVLCSVEGKSNRISIYCRWNWGRIVASRRIGLVTDLLLLRSQFLLCFSYFPVGIIRQLLGTPFPRVAIATIFLIIGLRVLIFGHDNRLLR